MSVSPGWVLRLLLVAITLLGDVGNPGGGRPERGLRGLIEVESREKAGIAVDQLAAGSQRQLRNRHLV